MRFETEKNQVNCIRIVRDQDGNTSESVVATFDAHLKEVAPHIIAHLTSNEQQELIHWLDDRNVLQEQSISEIILYVLPGLLAEARNTIDKLPGIAPGLHEDLSTAIKSFSDALTTKSPDDSQQKNIEKPDLKQMASSEALKEILNILKKKL